MTTMTHSVRAFPEARHSAIVTTALVVLFWVIAAIVVVAIHGALDSISFAGSVAVKIGAIAVVAYLYVKLTARHCTVDHALLVGIAWLVLDIAAEIATASHLGKGWFALTGTPMKPAVRDVLLLAWVAAPALFARHPPQTPR
jgi:hypothetical protein